MPSTLLFKLSIRRLNIWNANGVNKLAVINNFLNNNACKENSSNRRRMLHTFEQQVFQQTSTTKFSTTAEDLNTNELNNFTNNNITNKINKTNDDTHQKQITIEYEKAVEALNLLQSNAESLRTSTRLVSNNLDDTIKFLTRSGLSLDDLDRLSYIHVSGTKGKGSTCALTESILRSYGVKTGFFSSPHLVSLTERIRINGTPIEKEKFTRYFWQVHKKLESSKEHENDMPAYFRFLTILCLHVFLAEKVDVAILEVGIGGELDSTNIIRNTKTVGITSLGLEHTQVLGNTLPEIAWQKAGIIKPNSTVYTSVTQNECLKVIKERCLEKNASLYIVPKLDEYFKKNSNCSQTMENLNNFAILNGSLAIQLAYDWLRQSKNGFKKDYDINKSVLTAQAAMGLFNCNWPGRCQKLKFSNYNMHLDGAHTAESMEVCGKWFHKISPRNENPKILIFNNTGDRDTKKLLQILRNYSNFELACFVPNIASAASMSNSQDTKSVLFSQVEQLKRAQTNALNWQLLCEDNKENNNAMSFTSIAQCFDHIRNVFSNEKELDILVTGSLHLLGATILSLNAMPK